VQGVLKRDCQFDPTLLDPQMYEIALLDGKSEDVGLTLIDLSRDLVTLRERPNALVNLCL
jgi:hypothetical protein